MSKLYVDEISANVQNKISMNNAIGIPDGSEANPSLNINSEPTSGLYKKSNGELGISVLGKNVATFSSSGIYFNTFRNLIINGNMNIHQRSASVTGITASSYNTADRWVVDLTSQGTWTQTVELNDAPTGSGLRKSLRMLCTTANATPGSSSVIKIRQTLEAQNCNILKIGSSSAESITISFWVKSNVTGTYIVELENQTVGSIRIVCGSYTINTIGVWERKSITVSGDTVGLINNDNGVGLLLAFYLGAGSNFTSGTLQTTWGTTVTGNRAVGQTNVASATNNYFQITGIQMETGTIATPYEILPYEIELQRCMRYYQKSFLLETFPSQNAGRTSAIEFPSPVGASISLQIPIYLPVVMRTTLSSSNVTIFNPSATNAQVRNVNLNTDCTLTSIGSSSGNKNIYVTTTTPASTVAGHTLSFHYTANADL
jgi:hypothetical protein